MSISNHTVYPLEKIVRTLEQLEFDDRQIKEVKLAYTYNHALDPDGTPSFLHGTTGHNSLIIIAKLANLLHEHYQPRQTKVVILEGKPSSFYDDDKDDTDADS